MGLEDTDRTDETVTATVTITSDGYRPTPT